MSRSKHNPTYAKIGERIREIREQRGMTQSELAGDDITRNMLSRIENGAALPSLPSLCAIAKRLDAPVGVLFGDAKEYEAYRIGSELHALIELGEFEKALTLYDASKGADLSADTKKRVAAAAVDFAYTCYNSGRLSEALRLLDFASEISEPSERAYVLYELVGLCNLTNADVKCDESDERLRQGIFDDNAEALYLYAMKSLDSLSKTEYTKPHEMAQKLCSRFVPLIENLSDGVFKAHIDAKLDMISADYLSAKAKLIKVLSPQLPLPILWAIYADLEFCCKCCYDFENAYKYSQLRLELIKQIT